MRKDGCVHRYDEVTGTAKLSSSTPGQYGEHLQLGRTKRPKSKIRSDLDFGDKNRKISGFETIEKSVDSARIPLGGGSEIRPEGQRAR